MKLSWSYAVLNVKGEKKILDFHTGCMGFTVSDRGPIGENGSSIIFMSQNPDEHHQLAIVPPRQDDEPANSLSHLAFWVETFDDVKTLKQRLESSEVGFLPLCRGNTLSLYFSDPEGNDLEVFWDTPWHAAQPDSIVWDVNLDGQQALA